MMKIFRYALYALGALVLLLAAALAYIFFMFDPNSLKPQIEKRVTESTQRQLRLKGQIKLRVWPSVGATLDQASWSEYRSSRHFVELGHINVNLAFWPLLQQRFVVQELDLDGLKGRLVRHSDGSLSIDDLIQPQGKKAASSGPVQFDVDKVRIRNAAFAFEDRLQKRNSSIDQMDLSADHINSAGLDNLKFVARITNSSPAVAVKLAITAAELRLPAGKPIRVRSLQLDSSGALPAQLALQKLALKAAELSVDPKGPISANDIDLQLDAEAPQGSVKNLSLQLARVAADSLALRADLTGLRLSGEASARQGQLKALKLELGHALLQLNGESSLENLVMHAEGSTPEIKGIVLDLKTSARTAADGSSASLAGLIVTASGQKQQQALSIHLDVPQTVYAAQQLSAAHLKARATLKAPQQSADVEARITGLSTDIFNSVKLQQLQAQGKVAQGQDGASFTLNSPLNVQLQGLQLDLPALTLDARLTTPQLKTGSAAIKVRGNAAADIGKQAASARLAGQFDRSQGHVHAAIKGFKQPAINFDVGLDQLNLDHYLASSAPAGQPQPAAKDAAPQKIDLSPLAGLNLDGKLTIGSMQKDKLQAKNLAVTVQAGNGRLHVPSLTVQAFDGSLTGSLSATTTANPSFQVKQKLSGVDINQVLTLFADFRKLRGHGNAVVDLTASGNSVELLKKSAQGTISARLTDGAWTGINIGKTLRETRTLLSGGLQTRPSVADEETDFSEMTATVKLAGGIASNDDLAAKSPLLRIAGQGQANLVNSTLDYRVQASVVGTSQGQGGKDLEQLKGLTVPVRIKGTFDKPTYALDYSAMLKDSTKAKLEEQKKQLQDKAKQEIEAVKQNAQQQLDKEKQKVGDKLQNELQKGIGKLFGQPK